MPTYWMGLMAIFVFFYVLRWAPPPMGRLSIEVVAPTAVTGSILVDCMLEGNWRALGSALAHLALPVACFTLLAAAPTIKQSRAILIEIMNSDYVRYARANGFSKATIRKMGLGQWGLNAILLGDFAVVQGYVLTLALFSVFIFMVIDLIVMLLEPRR